MIDIFAELDKKFNIVDKTSNLCEFLVQTYHFEIGFDTKTFYGVLKENFHGWHLNNNFKNLDDMLGELSFAKLIGPKYERKISFIIKDENDCYAFLQFIKNANEYLLKKYSTKRVESEFRAVNDKINNIIERVNLKFIYDEQKKYYKLVENKTLVREIAQNTNATCASLLYEYNAVEIKDDVDKKKAILVNLATYTEPITKAYTKNSGDIYELFDNLDFALNNFHIRHNNLEGKKKKDYLLTLNEKQRIELYDATYDLILATLSQSQNQASLDKIKGLKSNF